MNKGEFETIVIMQANKNKEISNLAEVIVCLMIEK